MRFLGKLRREEQAEEVGGRGESGIFGGIQSPTNKSGKKERDLSGAWKGKMVVFCRIQPGESRGKAGREMGGGKKEPWQKSWFGGNPGR